MNFYDCCDLTKNYILPTYTPLKSTNLGSQLIVSLVDIFGTKINQIKQQYYFILPIICNDFLKRVKFTAENKQNVPTLCAKIQTRLHVRAKSYRG